MTKMINLNDLSKEELIDNVEFIGIQLIAKENEYDELLEKHNKLKDEYKTSLEEHLKMAKEYEKILREYNALMKKTQAKNKPVKKMIPKLRIVA